MTALLAFALKGWRELTIAAFVLMLWFAWGRA